MRVAQQKLRENIAEYLLYMFQIEHVIRSFNFNLDAIIDVFVQPTLVDDSFLNQYKTWYSELIVQMQKQDDMGGLLAFTRMTGDLVKAMRNCPQPIISAIDGICAGAGAMIALGSDLRLGTPRSRTAFLFNRVGLAGCDMGACALLPRMIGQGRASELLYTGRDMTAQEGLAWGFFNSLAEPEQLLPEARNWATRIADGPTFGNAMTKKMLHQEWNMGLDEAIEAEAQAQAICMQTEDFHRAYHAFVARQQPVFQGD